MTKHAILGPVVRVDQFPAPHYYAPASLYSNSGARKYLNESERIALIKKLALLPEHERLFVLTLLWTGVRVSEALAITPQCFQIEQSIVAVRTLKRRMHVVREIPIPPPLMAALSAYFELRAVLAEDGLAARAPLWGFHRVTAWRLIKWAMAQAGIQGKRATPRGLRHAFGVGTLGCGVPLNIVQRLLGHSSIRTTTIYTEACGPEVRRIVARFWDGSGSGI